jgi:hypothetical protein
MAEVDVAGTGGTPKKLNMVVGGERYRTGASYLIADDGTTTYLFRALNSKYFVQRQGRRIQSTSLLQLRRSAYITSYRINTRALWPHFLKVMGRRDEHTQRI